MRRNLAWLIVGLLFVCLTAGVRGEDFRVDTEVFRGSNKEPIAEILTIFSGGNVYDFQQAAPHEITISEPRRGVVTLLNVQHKKKAVVDMPELINAAINMQAAAAQAKNNPVFVAAAQPVFNITSSENTENNSKHTKLVFANKTLQYTVTGQLARHPGAANDYRHFSDLSARLGSLRSGGLPAGARLEVNAEIAKNGLLPTRVERVIHESLRKSEVRTEHLVVWTLAAEDRRRIDMAGNYLVEFTLIDFNEFCALK